MQITKSPSALHNKLDAWWHLANAIRVVFQPKIAQKSTKPLFWRSKSSKVIALGGNRKSVYNFLLLI